jgi:acyl carrier protein
VNPTPLFFSLNSSRKEQTIPALNEIYARVTKVLVHALGVEEGDIKSSATLQGDLGAESIDFLDVTFRLEREFGIKHSPEDLTLAALSTGS